MIARQKVLLKLIKNEGGQCSKLRLVKLAFLLRKESKNLPGTALYEFLPYHFGPFSFTLYHDVASLESQGILAANHDGLALTSAASSEIDRLDRGVNTAVDWISARYRAVATERLVDDVYGRFPWYTLNSKNAQKRRVQRPDGSPAIYTVGYEKLMLDGLLNLLLRKGIRRLVDVRNNPVARRFGFHKSTLQRHCADVGIDYLHLPELGIISAWRESLETADSYERLFQRYEREILPVQSDRLRELAARMSAEPCAIMCMEADHAFCHRSRLGRRLAEMTGLPVCELREPA